MGINGIALCMCVKTYMIRSQLRHSFRGQNVKKIKIMQGTSFICFLIWGIQIWPQKYKFPTGTYIHGHFEKLPI